jgi:Flp pilus assembly protein TadD
VTALDEAVRLKSDFADAYNNLGAALYQAQQFDRAIEAYSKSLALKPGSAETHNNIGKLYVRTKRYKEAVTSFKAAIAIKADFAEAHFNLGVADLAIGNKQGALDEYNLLKTLDPKLAAEFFDRFIKK